ncbi:molybdopterin molybdotransferase MoeA [Microbacterium sp. zg.B48]|uniref:molybdopterin molybdotransferase MoeA n=1 Tax=Microbacterium sp. zg.B48 TaxID=2969408 RepID=UPI00214C3FAF|nr:gephyrin-like molybdotransferase Glp [Microbacterium sp. zg.B48]MCR2762381.1 molybdopterin molybdotransferase MoeA [Microbacterium sp. zg.B48]
MHRIAVEEYAAIIRDHLAPLLTRPLEHVPLALAAGRVTADDVRSPIALPSFRNSQMDGFAVHAADLRRIPVRLPVLGEIAAGAVDPAALPEGSAIAIMTGAPLPAGADAVVPVEDTRLTDGVVEILRGRDAGDHVREAGSDLAAGEVLLPAGLRLASRHLAALAAANLMDVAVRARVRLAVISTGNELVPPGTPLRNGRLPDANGIAIATAASAAGAEVVDLQLSGDDAAQLGRVIDRSIAAGAELVLTSGGISMGTHEPVRQLLEPLGATVGTVDMQPGGPQAYARYRTVPVVCFPGNPVSSQLGFALFVAPLLRDLAGLPPAARAPRVLAAPLQSVCGRRQFLRGRLTDDDRVATVAGPGSHLVAALAAADVLIDVPAEVTVLPAGATVDTVDL